MESIYNSIYSPSNQRTVILRDKKDTAASVSVKLPHWSFSRKKNGVTSSGLEENPY